MKFCAWEGREFDDEDFEPDGSQFIHKGMTPRHNTLGETLEDELPGAEEEE